MGCRLVRKVPVAPIKHLKSISEPRSDACVRKILPARQRVLFTSKPVNFFSGSPSDILETVVHRNEIWNVEEVFKEHDAEGWVSAPRHHVALAQLDPGTLT